MVRKLIDRMRVVEYRGDQFVHDYNHGIVSINSSYPVGGIRWKATVDEMVAMRKHIDWLMGRDVVDGKRVLTLGNCKYRYNHGRCVVVVTSGEDEWDLPEKGVETIQSHVDWLMDTEDCWARRVFIEAEEDNGSTRPEAAKTWRKAHRAERLQRFLKWEGFGIGVGSLIDVIKSCGYDVN